MTAGRANPDINQRTPLLPAMESLLRSFAQLRPGEYRKVTRFSMSEGDKTRIRALSHRGYLEQGETYSLWRITDAGRAAVGQLQAMRAE